MIIIFSEHREARLITKSAGGIFCNGKFNVVKIEIIAREMSSAWTRLAVKFIRMI